MPSGVAVSLGVRSREKVVAWATSGVADSGTPAYAVATTHALYVQSLDERVAWHRVSKATWEEPVLTVVLLDEGREPGRVLRIRLDDARDLPPAVYDRVSDSVQISERVNLRGEAGARLVARRDSEDGSIRWSVVFDAGLDPADPDLRTSVDEALGRLRDSLGI